MIAENTITQIRQVPMLSIIQQFVKLQRNGSNYVGPCPFHNEKTPSFSVHPAKGKFHCFGCGAKGSNAIDFIMQLQGLSFTDAVEQVASMSGITIEGENNYTITQQSTKAAKPIVNIPPTIIPEKFIQPFTSAYNRSFLYSGFVARFGTYLTDQVFKLYGVGSYSGYRDFAEDTTTLFIQRDIQGHVRQLNSIVYDPTTLKRRREPAYTPKKIGKQLLIRKGMNEADVNLVQCFYGEHQLQGNSKPVAIVESEKSAMVATLYYPQFVWLATGGTNGMGKPRPQTWGVLNGRKVYLFPDVDAFAQWSEEAEALENITGEQVKVIDIMNGQPVPAGKEKYNIADLLLDSGRKPSQAQPALEEANTAVVPPTQVEGVSILLEHVISAPIEIITPAEYGSLILKTIYTTSGNYDLLLTAEGEPMQEHNGTVKSIESFFNKSFQSATIDNEQCLLHQHN